jgi:hypothetical protein
MPDTSSHEDYDDDDNITHIASPQSCLDKLDNDDVDATREQKPKKASLLHDRVPNSCLRLAPRNSHLALAWKLSYDFVVAATCRVQHCCTCSTTWRLKDTCTVRMYVSIPCCVTPDYSDSSYDILSGCSNRHFVTLR